MALSLQRYKCSNDRGEVTTILKKRMKREEKRSPKVLLKNIGGSLPEQVIMEILSWLPVISLLKFKVVCKSWYAIIKNPYLISKHLQNFYSKNDDYCRGCLIAQHEETQVGELEVHELLMNDKIQRVLACEKIQIPISNAYTCGPCDGIYYVWCCYEEGRFLWNPALNEFKKLPPMIKNPNLPSHFESVCLEHYGFGYDSITKDYKVIVTKSYWATSKDLFSDYDDDHLLLPLSIFIYSLREDSWRYWGDLSKYYSLNHNKCYVFLNDNVYWLGSIGTHRYRDFDMIIAFNLANETYQELKAPSYERPAIIECPVLAICHESIALLVSYKERNSFVMWYLNEGQWSKKCTIKFDFELYCQPLGHWKDNKMLFVGDDKPTLYDVETQETWCLTNPKNYHGDGRCTTVSLYKESLVSVIDRNM